MLLSFQIGGIELAQQISLYLDLESGSKVDIEVAARMALAWSSAIKEVGAHIAPDAILEIKLESGSEGSLSLNGLVKAAQRNLDPITLKVIVVTGVLFILKEGAAWGLGEVLDWMRGEDAIAITQGLSDDDIQSIAKRVASELAAKTGDNEVRLVFREAEKDKAIKGVGSKTASGKRPRLIVPRDEFQTRSIDAQTVDDEIETRQNPRRLKLVIIRPVLKVDTKKVWRFQSGTGEIGAVVKDDGFLTRALTGEEAIPLREGVVLDVLLDVTETREGGSQGAWQPKSYAVKRVYGYALPEQPTSLFDTVNPQK